jgi:hypothetical protein
VLTFLAGYPAPSVLGLAGALLVADGRSRLMLWIAVGLLVVTLVLVRNGYGWLAVLATGVLIGYVAGWAPGRVQVGFAAALCWFLLLGGLRATGSCGPGAAARRTPTCSPASRTCPARCGGCSSGWWRAPPRSRAAYVLLV